MTTLRKYSDQELKEGILRCQQRLQGTRPMGLLTPEMTKTALHQYKVELQARGIQVLKFKNE